MAETQDVEGSINVVMLPDFTEQIAISDVNLAAYSNYSLTFRDGWQLTTLEGTWDSTAVPAKILQVLGNAISAASDVKVEQLKKEAKKVPTVSDIAVSAEGKLVQGVLIRHEYLPPGLYKMLKADECDQISGQGMLTELGIPSQYETTLRVLSAP